MPNASLWDKYQKLLRERPFTMSLVQSGTISALGNLTAQLLSGGGVRAQPVIEQTLLSVTFIAPICSMWFPLLGSFKLHWILATAVDQFLFSPFLSSPLSVGYFSWRDLHFSVPAARSIFRPGFYFDRIFPVQVAGWCIWIPGVCLVYFMPSELQIPVATLLQSFWVLVFLLVNRPRLTR